MRSSSMIFAFLATIPAAVTAMPIEDDPGHIETIVYKRDVVLTQRHLELAESHGVNTTEMFMHSLYRRSDGDDVTIWVDNSYEETETDPRGLAARQLPLTAPGFQSTIHQDSCGRSNIRDRSSTVSPFTGGVTTMRNWGLSRWGGFGGVGDVSRRTFWTIVVAGSNSGSNAHFSIIPTTAHQGRTMRVGTQDIGDLCRDTLNWYQAKFGSSWRVGSDGTMPCGTGSSSNPRSVDVMWRIGPVNNPRFT